MSEKPPDVRKLSPADYARAREAAVFGRAPVTRSADKAGVMALSLADYRKAKAKAIADAARAKPAARRNPDDDTPPRAA